jgi:hypothetical protein
VGAWARSGELTVRIGVFLLRFGLAAPQCIRHNRAWHRALAGCGQLIARRRLMRMADILAKEHGEIWINHDKPQRESLKLASAFYE